MNPYSAYATGFEALVKGGRMLPMGNIAPRPRRKLEREAPKALIFSPHPDDECIIGGLPLRLLDEAGIRVVNVAVTQGSNKSRQQGRLEELRRACEFMGFGLIQTKPEGLEGVNEKTRDGSPGKWAESVEIVRGILEREKPFIIFTPHREDWNSTHIGTHWLVVDALRGLGKDFRCHVVETEYWGQNNRPNLMVECSAGHVADLVAGTSFHVGEVTRNPFHLLLPAWMQDNVRRGSELVGGQGEAAPDFTFATLYRQRLWRNGDFEEAFAGGKTLPLGAAAGGLFGSLD